MAEMAERPFGMFILMQITRILQIFPFFRYISVSSVIDNLLCLIWTKFEKFLPAGNPFILLIAYGEKSDKI